MRKEVRLWAVKIPVSSFRGPVCGRACQRERDHFPYGFKGAQSAPCGLAATHAERAVRVGGWPGYGGGRSRRRSVHDTHIRGLADLWARAALGPNR